ncbi:hypothetical protein FOL47_000362 [Perkinsus chesapeaki]|uniref:Uncharacterized protein n=1 Tax=Perkinsus chesapeaki TaxID=330153 RepID=A0A7J6KYI5_PERCH|nr:hypothetical protein FOL47_000362 [Perkinsus chesapeaki]
MSESEQEFESNTEPADSVVSNEESEVDANDEEWFNRIADPKTPAPKAPASRPGRSELVEDDIPPTAVVGAKSSGAPEAKSVARPPPPPPKHGKSPPATGRTSRTRIEEAASRRKSSSKAVSSSSPLADVSSRRSATPTVLVSPPMPFQMGKSFEDPETMPEDLDRFQSWAKSQSIGFVQAKEHCESLLPTTVERVLRWSPGAKSASSWDTWIPSVLEATQQVLGGPQLAVQFHHMSMGDKDLREFYQDVYNIGRTLHPHYDDEMLNAVIRPVFVDGLTPQR